MKVFYSFLLMALSIIGKLYPALAQPTNIDSLELLLKQQLSDTVKIDTYLSLHQAYVSSDTTQAMDLLRSAIVLGESIDDEERLCKSYLKLCDFLWRRGRLPEAQQALIKANQYRTFLNNTQLDASYFIQQGVVFLKSGEYQDAGRHFLEAAAIYEILGDTVGWAKCYNNLGTVYWELDRLDEAMNYYQTGLKLVENTAHKRTIANFLGNIGLIYRAKDDHKSALQYYTQSLEINRELGNLSAESIDLHNIGVLYTKQSDYQKALTYFGQAYDACQQINDQIGILYAIHAMATSNAKLGNFSTALDQAEQALLIAKQLGVKEEIKNLYQTRSDIFQEMGHYQLAFEERIIYESWKDNLINENHLNRIKELEVQYETAKKNEEIALLSKEKVLNEARLEQQTTQNRALWGELLLIVTIAALVVYLLRQRLKNQQVLTAKNEEVKAAQFKQQLSELEMKALRAQMNPHFIFNCLNSINRMVLSGESQSAGRYLTKFAKLIRLMLENSEYPTVTLEDELAMLEAYLELECLRFKEKISYRISVDESVDRESTHLPSMVLQPFIENAIWHGLMHKKDQGVININIQEEDFGLKCTIQDNGVGREQSLVLKDRKVLKKRSLGIKITEERLKLFNREKLEELIQITDLKDSMNQALGTRVDILIPTI